MPFDASPLAAVSAMHAISLTFKRQKEECGLAPTLREQAWLLTCHPSLRLNAFLIVFCTRRNVKL